MKATRKARQLRKMTGQCQCSMRRLHFTPTALPTVWKCFCWTAPVFSSDFALIPPLLASISWKKRRAHLLNEEELVFTTEVAQRVASLPLPIRWGEGWGEGFIRLLPYRGHVRHPHSRCRTRRFDSGHHYCSRLKQRIRIANRCRSARCRANRNPSRPRLPL